MPTFPTHKAYRNITIEQNQTNFPSVAHAFFARDATSTSLVDAFGSGDVTGLTGIEFGTNANNARYMYHATGLTNTGTATFTDIGTSPFILFAVAKTASHIFTIGSSASGGRCNLNSTPVAHDGTTSISSGALTIPVGAHGRANIILAYNSASSAQSWASDGTNEYFPAATATTSLGAISFTNDVISMNVNATEIYGIALFKFASIPGDYRRALSWMTQNWIEGNLMIYPGWKGLS